MNPFEMVVMIVFISAVASVLRAKYGVTHGEGKRQRGRHAPQGFTSQVTPDADTDRMQDEIKGLKERIAVLERVITDTNSAAALDREIDKLR
jgi:hypothetical protein